MCFPHELIVVKPNEHRPRDPQSLQKSDVNPLKPLPEKGESGEKITDRHPASLALFWDRRTVTLFAGNLGHNKRVQV